MLTMDNFTGQLDDMKGLLLSFAYKLTKNNDDAKDLYQETAFRAIVNQEKFREGTNLKAWLFTIMRNIFINAYRKKLKNNTIFDATDNLYYLNAGSKTVGNAAESAMIMEELLQVVETLEDAIRVPFVMHYYGYKYQEIAEQLDLPLGTVKSRIFFARRELKTLIEERYNITHLSDAH